MYINSCVCVCVFKTVQGTVAVTFAEFPVIRLTSGQASVSGSVNRIIIEPSAMLRPVGYILYVFLRLLSKNPYSFSSSPRSFSLGTSLEAIFILSFLANHSEASVIQLSAHKEKCCHGHDRCITHFFSCDIAPRCTIPSPFPTNTQFLQSQPHCSPLLLLPYSNLQSTPLEGDKRAGVRAYTPLCSAVQRGATTEKQMFCFPVITD